MFEVTRINGSDAGNVTSNFTVNFRLTSITVMLVALIWLPSFLKLITLLGGGVKTSAIEASTQGLLEHFSMAIDPDLKELPHANPGPRSNASNEDGQIPIEEEEIDLSSRTGRSKERTEIYEKNRGIFVTHILEPSKTPNQKYDIFIYLVRHKKYDFSDVDKAEFFFGNYWGNRIFPATRTNNRIGVSTSAYGPFLCTCLVTFIDGYQVSIYRYIDFEMGDVVTKAFTS